MSMHVKTIGVKGLFGVFDHKIPLQNADRVTVVHGPNGFGKTVMLKMIAAAASGSTSIFEHTPFTEFSLTLEDETTRTIRRHKQSGKKGKHEVQLELIAGDAGSPPQTFLPRNLPESILYEVDSNVPPPFHISAGGWIDDDGNQYPLDEIIRMFPNAANAIPKKYQPRPIVENLRIFFIDTNRLGSVDTIRADGKLPLSRYASLEPVRRGSRIYYESGRTRRFTPRVKQDSEDLLQRIQSTLADYAKSSQESDRTFPERLVGFVREPHQVAPEGEILAKMAELEKKRQRLISLGLLDKETGLRDLSEQDVLKAPEALTIYVEDVQEKLKVFDDLANRIGSLMDIVNGRFKYKKLRVDRAKGFHVLSGSEQTIDLEDLSSGEQHQLVVLYDLLFRAPRKGLVLIDEPEISLHVAWQSRFLPDLIAILDVIDAYAIVATHSPVIIGNRSDLAVELKGPPTATPGTVNA